MDDDRDWDQYEEMADRWDSLYGDDADWEYFEDLMELLEDPNIHDDLSADGVLADILEEFGLREDWWDWDVGDTGELS